MVFAVLALTLVSACSTGASDGCFNDLTAESCLKHDNCKHLGQCGLALRDNDAGLCNSCAPTKEQHCLQSDACKQVGQCFLRRESDEAGNYCAVPWESECPTSERCKSDGKGCKYEVIDDIPRCID